MPILLTAGTFLCTMLLAIIANFYVFPTSTSCDCLTPTVLYNPHSFTPCQQWLCYKFLPLQVNCSATETNCWHSVSGSVLLVSTCMRVHVTCIACNYSLYATLFSSCCNLVWQLVNSRSVLCRVAGSTCTHFWLL